MEDLLDAAEFVEARTDEWQEATAEFARAKAAWIAAGGVWNDIR